MDDYLAGLPEEQKEALAQVRAVVERAAPDAEEGVSYGMPAYLYAGRPLLGFRAAKKHLSVFPFSPEAVDAVKDRLALRPVEGNDPLHPGPPGARGRPGGPHRGPKGRDRRQAVTIWSVTGKATDRRTS